ncbi:MAG: aminotransferase class III-fold pyridoxal phosphate-dependent enzyme [Caldilineaceae bacterium]|nr:aminotransferase class III-fold pyridoxal phosphate-dependent enzyme [Caldilineaceae bacterium]
MSTPNNLSLQRSLELFGRAQRRVPGAAQTNSKRPSQFAFGGYPIYAERASGGRIIDVDGNEYIDLVQALGPVILGYCYPAVDAAIAAQLERGIIYGLMSPLEVECAELLGAVVPCAEMVRFLKGGGEATAAAARVVRGYTKRPIILNCGYRGWPDVWAVQTGDPGVPAGLQGSVEAFAEFDLAALQQQFQTHRGQVAAVFLDIQRSAPPAGYLAAVKELCHENGALLVYDEIVTGFRLALGGMQAYAGVTPDLACFAKALANGMPLACVAGRADVMASMAERSISITYGGEALSLAAAIATLHELQEKQVPAYLWELGAFLQRGLNEAAQDAGIPFSCGGLGPMTTMNFTESGGQPEALLWEYLLQEMAVRGVLLRRGGLNFLTFSHTQADLTHVINAAAEVLVNLRRLWGTAQIARAVEARKQQ